VPLGNRVKEKKREMGRKKKKRRIDQKKKVWILLLERRVSFLGEKRRPLSRGQKEKFFIRRKREKRGAEFVSSEEPSEPRKKALMSVAIGEKRKENVRGGANC